MTTAIDLLRVKRNKLLKESDTYVLPDYPHESDFIKQQWYKYRTSLRDLPSISNPTLLPDGTLDDSSVNWPVSPLIN
jgi:hypothetical protein